MSMVASYIKCKDDKWYRDLTYADKTNDWFICFDDDDPVELVVFDSCKKNPLQILRDLDFPYRSIFKAGACNRLRPLDKNSKFGSAKAFFIDLREGPLPLPPEGSKWDEAFNSKPSYQGVYYGES